MNKPHPHAALMLQYAQDAAETDRPWVHWEFKFIENQQAWCPLFAHPLWQPDYEYRRKPKTIRINGIEVPEPLRVAPKYGEMYFLADPTVDFPRQMSWDGFDAERLLLKHGLLHTTREAAIAHRGALLSFTSSICFC